MQDINYHDNVNINKFMFLNKVSHRVYSFNVALNVYFKA